jgi:hypothetical protein
MTKSTENPPDHSAKTLSARIEVFRPGTFTPMKGEPITYSAADLRAIADAYSPDTAPAPIVVGHPSIDAPAYGWIEGFEYDAQAERLFANLGQVEPQFADMVKGGRFKKVSMAFFAPDQSHNPVPGTWYPKHLGFLGAAPPAVPGLKNVAFAAQEGVTFTSAFGEPGFERVAAMFRAIRDWFIEREGVEAADKVLPSWSIDWLAEAEIQTTEGDAPLYSAPTPITQEIPVTQPDTAFAAREAELTARAADIAAREARLNHADNAAFAETMVTEGRLLPASRDALVALMDALPGHAAVAFSAGSEKLTPGAALREILKAQPKIVTFGALDLPPETGGGTAEFAADGREVDAAGLVTHQKALAFQKTHPGTDYLAAVAAVMA